MKRLSEQGGVMATPVGLKWKKVEEDPSKQVEVVRPLTFEVTPAKVPPPIVEVVDDEILQESVQSMDDTLSQCLALATSRAKAMVTEQDLNDYAKATSDDVSHLMVHFLMRVNDF